MATIRQNALCIELARCIHALAGPYHGTTMRAFDLMPAREQQRWIEEAEVAFEAAFPLVKVQPTRPDYFDLATGRARDEARKVIAKITPETPWGDPVIDPRD
jgi:hypothetical protein